MFICLIGCFTIAYSQSPIKRIGFTNPTIRTIEKLVYLVQHHYVNLENVQFIGIIDASQTELLKTSKQYVTDHGYAFVSFEVIRHQLSLDSLFELNSCSLDFLRIFKETDAMIFFGGADIPPVIYGERTLLTTELIGKEQNWELSFLYHLIGGYQHVSFQPYLSQRPDYIVLGICLGMQEMNVASGGSLIQDIPSQLYQQSTYEDILAQSPDEQHRNYWNKTDNLLDEVTAISFHHLKVLKDSDLEFGVGNFNPTVVSVHHQAVKMLGANFSTTATSMDGKVIEAMTNNKFPNSYGIQFHTDVIGLYDEGTVFNVAHGKTFHLDTQSKQFHVNFWNDFTKRIIGQKAKSL